MQAEFNGAVVELVQGDITAVEVDAIVNAANSRLAGGGGVDGAIHRRGGKSIMAESDRRYPDGCPTGSAVITAAGDLPARYVIHAVGPRYRDGTRGEAGQLASAYRTSLELALENNCQSIAFPALSAGAYGYPLVEAARLAVETARDFLLEHGQPSLIRFVLFSDDVLQAFAKALNDISKT